MKLHQLTYIGMEKQQELFDYLEKEHITYSVKENGDINLECCSAVEFIQNFKNYLTVLHRH